MRIWVVVVSVGATLIPSVVSLEGCEREKCGEAVVQSVSSNNGDTTAKVMRVNCGATTDYFTYVTLQTGRVKLRDDGIVFGYKGDVALSLRWSGNRELHIECPKCDETKVYRLVAKEEQYHIEYN